MRRLFSVAFALVFVAGVAACGGGEQGTAQKDSGAEKAKATAQKSGGSQQAAGELTMPEWMTVDEEANTVTMDIVSGESDANNSWNFNGYHAGDNARIVVPQGAEVTINFTNQDELTPHSLGIDAQTSNFPATFQEVEPVFEGALTPGATSMSDATQTGETDTITFTASEAGDYAVVCYLPGHANQGMWIHFRVSAEGEAGVQEL